MIVVPPSADFKKRKLKSIGEADTTIIHCQLSIINYLRSQAL